MGYSVADAGDIDGDGYADVMVGAPFHDFPNYPDSGVAWILKGPSGTFYRSSGIASLNGRIGEAVLGPGDRDGDGEGEFVIGARIRDSS